MSDGQSGKEKLPIKEITGQNGRRQDSVILNEVPREDAGFGRLPREPEHLKTRNRSRDHGHTHTTLTPPTAPPVWAWSRCNRSDFRCLNWLEWREVAAFLPS